MTESLSSSGVYGRDEAGIRAALDREEIPVAVYGLGKMGLPLAGVLAETTGNVVGADVDPDVVETVAAGGCHVKREPGLAELVDEQVASGALSATVDPAEAAAEASVHVVIVPTPITDEKEPDLAILDAVVESIGEGLSRGDLVVIESTVPPRTTAERVWPALCDSSGLEAGEFGVAFCPERTSSGRALEDIRGAYPKVVGGVDEASTAAAATLYDAVNAKGVLPVSDATTAECVKVFEGLYRDVNIALANELGRLTDEIGIDVREAIEVANTQPFCDIHEPGPGVGGHCIPYYPYFVIRPFDGPTPLLETAREVNDAMPSFTIERVCEGLSGAGVDVSDATVVVLGLTYRPGVEEIRASPAIPITHELAERGVAVYGVDPVLEDYEEFACEHLSVESFWDVDPDAVVVVTPHEEFDELSWADENGEGTPVVIDGRESLEAEAGGRQYTIGTGWSSE